jgi:hypothetical protein
MPARNGVILWSPPRRGGPDFLRSLVYQTLRHKFPRHEIHEEYRFDVSRRWRFDLALFPSSAKVAVEYQGGLWTGGRHVRGQGYMDDCEKVLAAAAQGWVVIPVVYDHLRDRTAEVLDLLIRTLEIRRARDAELRLP